MNEQKSKYFLFYKKSIILPNDKFVQVRTS